MNTLPPFYVGQRVVAIVDHHQGAFKKGDEFTIGGVRFSCCTWEVTIGLKNSTELERCIFCLTRTQIIKGGDRWFYASRFAPIQTNFQEITYQQVMENESSLINCN